MAIVQYRDRVGWNFSSFMPVLWVKIDETNSVLLKVPGFVLWPSVQRCTAKPRKFICDHTVLLWKCRRIIATVISGFASASPTWMDISSRNRKSMPVWWDNNVHNFIKALYLSSCSIFSTAVPMHCLFDVCCL